MSDPLQSPATPAETDAYRAVPQFAVSLSKLTVMSLFTLGLYEVYWCYNQRQAERQREHSDLSPFWRAFFAPLWAFSLFPRIQRQAAKHGVTTSWSPTALASFFLLLNAAWRLPDPYWLVSILSSVTLLFVQQSVNALNAAIAPEANRNDRYSGKNVFIIVVGAILLLLVILGALAPDPEGEQWTRQVAA